MAERSKELLHLEHKATSLSSLESAVLVCNNNKKGESSTQIKKLPPDASTAPLPPSQLLGEVKDFLGVMSEANKRLKIDAKDLMLGFADLHTPEAVAAAEHAICSGQHVVQLAADGSETNSDESSADEMESSDDEDNGKKPSLSVKRASSGVDDVHEKQKRTHSKKCPGIIELP